MLPKRAKPSMNINKFETAKVTTDMTGHDHDLIFWSTINNVRYVVSFTGLPQRLSSQCAVTEHFGTASICELASGMTAPDRLKDLADVQELIKIRSLSDEFAERLNPYVRDKYLELLNAVKRGKEKNVFEE